LESIIAKTSTVHNGMKRMKNGYKDKLVRHARQGRRSKTTEKKRSTHTKCKQDRPQKYVTNKYQIALW